MAVTETTIRKISALLNSASHRSQANIRRPPQPCAGSGHLHEAPEQNACVRKWQSRMRQWRMRTRKAFHQKASVTLSSGSRRGPWF